MGTYKIVRTGRVIINRITFLLVAKRLTQMPAYCFFDNLVVHDFAKLEEYKSTVAPTVQKYLGRYVLLGGAAMVMEGDWRPTYPVMIEFPNMTQALAWYNSAEYHPLKLLRQSAVRCNAVFMEGLEV